MAKAQNKAGTIKLRTELLVAGKTATGLQIPDEVVEQLGAGKKPAVKVTINGFTYRSSISSMGGVFMLPVSAAVRAGAGIAGGDTISLEIELDTEPREVELPTDFKKALEKNATAKKFYESLSYSAQQRYVLPIGDAKTEETRERRITKAISDLQAGKK